MCRRTQPPYNVRMNEPCSGPPPFAVAGVMVDAVAAHDFTAIAAVLEEEATLSALLPRGFDEWHGPVAICGAFEKWFGDVDHFEVAEASVGQVGELLQLRWRVRVQGGPRFAGATKVVEQHLYASTNPSGRIDRMRLLCSGFCDEHPDDTPKEHTT